MSTYVSYLRVSNSKSGGVRGLGMSAQKHAVAAFLKGKKPQRQFVEVESGRRNQRPQLQAAIQLCRSTKATLLIARLDRLSRNAAFLLTLQDSGVQFVCCDMPHADKFTIGILACVAQKEAELISERTKAALAAAKRKGTLLGNPRPAKSLKRGHATRREQAIAFAAKLKPVIARAQEHGATTLQELAECLNRLGYRTPTGKQWIAQSVRHLMQRMR